VRVGGRRAYKLARQGRDFEIASRPIDVHRIDVLRFDYPELVLEITCGTGTYIRSIGRDLGEQLAGGAVMTALERTAVGPFTLETSSALADIVPESLPLLIQSAAAAVPSLPRCIVDENAVRNLAHGRCVALPGVGDGGPDGNIAVVDGAAVGCAGGGDRMLCCGRCFLPWKDRESSRGLRWIRKP
jgi:tRNA pseudouridine55 synthase